ncbi:MAG TPA: NAD(P)H-hydrate dehydratase [Polyangiaceae bacterium]|nr:NAD(P)H-hydrate dehydratase [Polyangiaceae bacterium]
MKPVLSRAQMRAYDKFAVESCHVPGVVLMENAGRGAADVIERILGGKLGGKTNRVVVVCGAGNNGGDGFVVARHLHARGYEVTSFLIGASEKVTGDARINHDAYIDLGGQCVELTDGVDLGRLETELARAAMTVDALFGTGLARPIDGQLRAVVELVNRAAARRVALDIPSGLDADTGMPLGVAVRAEDTVTFGCLKLGLLTPDGARLAGRVHLVDLGVPSMVLDKVGHVAEVIESETVAEWISPREADVHKHAAGSVLCVAGSAGKLGAALLVGRSAMRGGAGLVTLASWPDAVDALELRVVELMSARIDRADIAGSLDRALAGKRTVVIGPGLGLDQDAKSAVEHILLRFEGTTIVDADALTLFAGRPEAFAVASGPIILTPHPGEAARLLGTKSHEVEQNRAGCVRELAQRARSTVVLKGARTMVAGSTGPLYINTTGNPALATAGAGDVLAGIIAALACVMPAERAAPAGVHVHGLAADRWRSQHGGADRGLLAGELGDLVPAVLAALAKGADPLTL